MDFSRMISDENEHQYFGFSSTELIIDIEKAISCSLKESLNAFQETAEKEAQEKNIPFDKENFEKKIQQVFDIYIEKAKEPFKLIEAEVRNIMEIPAAYLDEHEKIEYEEYTEEEIMHLEEENKELKKQLIREKLFVLKCKEMKKIMTECIMPIYEDTNKISPKMTQITDDKSKRITDLREEFLKYAENPKEPVKNCFSTKDQ